MTTVAVDPGPVIADATPEPQRRSPSIGFGVLLVLLYALLAVNLYWKLGLNNIERFDEARHAVNAYEMLRSGNPIANMYRGALDYWNLKPPLSFWVDIASFKLFGYTTFALRLPSTLAAFGTTALVTIGARALGGRAAAVIATGSMVTCYQLLTTHAWRTGDPDALFVFFLTAGLFGLLAARRRPWLLVVLTTGFSLAFLTKSFHAGLLLVFAIGYLIAVRRDSAVRLRHLAVSLLGFLPLLAWAAARYSFDGTKFFVGMVHEDLLSRTSAPIEGHSGSPLYYLRLIGHFYGAWLLVLVAAAIVLVVLKRTATRRRFSAQPFPLTRAEPLGMLIWAVLVVLAFSAVATKLPWYTLPAYPALAVVGGVAIGALVRPRPRSLAVIFVGASVLALGVSQALVTHSLLAVRADPLQVALATLHRNPAYHLESIYLDPAVHGGWQQQRVASAELNGDLVPRNGGVAGYEHAGKALLLVRKGSSTDKQHPELRSSLVTETSAYFIAKRG